MPKIFVILIFLSVLLNSCITFPVVSHTEGASTLPGRNANLSLGEYAREIFLSSRLGIYKGNFFGIDSGISFYYSLPSSDFFCYSVYPDLRISFFQNDKSKFGTGLGISFLSLYYTPILQINSQQNLYYVLPMYMESEITEWFSFILNFRFFVPIICSEVVDQTPYNKSFITMNAGVSFFNLVTIQGYMLASPSSENIFPVPGIQLTYQVNF